MANVSIVVPAYNAEKTIGRCIESVLAQDYRDLELIVLDDGSRDATPEILDRYAARDARIRVIHKENSGVSDTRNRGISEAEGRYLQFMDADDWLPKESTKLFVRAMEESNADLVIGDFYRVVGEQVSKKGSIEEPGVISCREYADHMMRSPADFYYGVLWNKFYRKEAIDQYGVRMDRNISYCEDMIFNLEYLLHAQTICVIKAPVYYYVKTEGSLVEKGTNIPGIIKMKTDVITYYNDFYKHILEPKDYMERMPVIYGYLIAVSTDGFSIPFFSNTKKLGREKGEPAYLIERTDSVMMTNYLTELLTDRYLNTAAQEKGLGLKESKLLYCISAAGQPLTAEQIAAYTGLPYAAVVVLLARLCSADHLQREKGTEGQERFRLADEKTEKAMERVREDCDRIMFRGFTEEERRQYREIQSRIAGNIEDYLA